VARSDLGERFGGAARDYAAASLHQLAAVDRAVYAAIASTPTPALDEPMRRLSTAANYSRIWLGMAAVLATAGGQPGRRAAARGVVAIGVTSALVNLGVKSLWDRERPDRSSTRVPIGRQVRMPASTSFPSGHSASGFAFATAVGHELPFLAVPLRCVAAAVAYSRVHTGVHYPADAIVGSVVGARTGHLVSALADRIAARRQRA
jgi:membrane-associated phospholipid phosphatase